MKLRIAEDYMIESDKLNYILKERKVTDPNHRFSNGVAKETWNDLGYFSKLSHLIDYLIELEIRQAVIDDLREFSARIDEIKDKYVKELSIYGR